MKLAHIGGSSDSKTLIVHLRNLKDQDGNDFELPPDPEDNLVIDPRPIYFEPDNFCWKFDVEIRGLTLIVTRIDENEDWEGDDLYFRAYDRTKEEVPSFDSSAPYVYRGLKYERAPVDAVVVKVHRTVKTIKYCAFRECRSMVTCDMSDALVQEIEAEAFCFCESLKVILFSPNLRTIGEEVFDRCEAIEIIVIPSTVTEIEMDTFYGCKNLKILKFPDAIDLDFVSNNMIHGCGALQNVIPHDVSISHWLKHRYDDFPLHKVCYNANVTIEEIQQCVRDHPDAATLSDEMDMTALHLMSIMIGSLLFHQENSSTVNPYALQGCIMACFHANMSAVFARDNKGKTPLDYLLDYSNMDIHTNLVESLCMHRMSMTE